MAHATPMLQAIPLESLTLDHARATRTMPIYGARRIALSGAIELFSILKKLNPDVDAGQGNSIRFALPPKEFDAALNTIKMKMGINKDTRDWVAFKVTWNKTTIKLIKYHFERRKDGRTASRK